MTDQDPQSDPIQDNNIFFDECVRILTARLRKQSKGGAQKDQMATMAQLAMAEMGVGNMAGAQKLVAKSEKYLLKYGQPKEKGYLMFLQGVFLSAQAKYDEGMPCAMKALDIFTRLELPMFVMRSLLLCGRFCIRLHMTDEAMEYVHRAIEISRQLGDKVQTILCMYNLNDIRGTVLPQTECIRNAEQLVLYMDETLSQTPTVMRANVYESAALANIRGGQVKKAKYYANIADEVRAQMKERNTTLMPDSYNMHAMICAAEEDEKGMLHHTDLAIALCRDHKIVLAELQAHEIRFRYYLRHSRLRLAKKHLDAAQHSVPKSDSHLTLSILSKCYSDYYHATGDIANELKHIQANYEYRIKEQQTVIVHRIRHLNAVHELAIREKENEIMRKELNIKTQELNLSNHYLQQRNELLNELKNSITQLKKENSQRETVFQTLFRKIDAAFLKEDNEKDLFREKFDKAHTDYIRHLSAAYPGLSPSECRICALLHSGFSTKEIATLLSTSERNVETHRLSIRKKLKLKRTDNLNLVLATLKF